MAIPKPPEHKITHPAKFTKSLIPLFADLLEGCEKVLDPFAGTGRIHELMDLGDFRTFGIELEAEWAQMHKRTRIGNALDLPWRKNHFDGVCTSPTYGNRLADHHNAKDGSVRHSYKHDLGRDLTTENSGQLHWGPKYREFHEAAWREVHRVLKPGGRFVLNLKDHIRKKKLMPVTGWHITFLTKTLDFELHNVLGMGAPALRKGANSLARAGNAEIVFLLVKPKNSQDE
tara:strand:+ start:641 stop:1330 length:690 start_codon:yes stop_codon:yes gene_type:complete